MKIIDPFTVCETLITAPHNAEILKRLEYAGRTCYKSEARDRLPRAREVTPAFYIYGQCAFGPAIWENQRVNGREIQSFRGGRCIPTGRGFFIVTPCQQTPTPTVSGYLKGTS
jgi:hypothetical protein